MIFHRNNIFNEWFVFDSIYFSNRTEWSPIPCVIIRVITKSDNREVGNGFVSHEYDYGSTSDYMKYHYQLIISIIQFPRIIVNFQGLPLRMWFGHSNSAQIFDWLRCKCQIDWSGGLWTNQIRGNCNTYDLIRGLLTNQIQGNCNTYNLFVIARSPCCPALPGLRLRILFPRRWQIQNHGIFQWLCHTWSQLQM